MSENINGVLLRGEKGLYFISDKDLEKFKVPHEQEVPAMEVLNKGGLLKAPHASGHLHVLAAVQGTLGERVGKLDWRAAAINPTIPGKIRLEALSAKGGAGD